MQMPRLSRNALVTIFILALLSTGLVDTFHYADVLEMEAIEKEARPARAVKMYAKGYFFEDFKIVSLSNPLGCEQFVAMRGAGEKWRPHVVCADFRERQ